MRSGTLGRERSYSDVNNGLHPILQNSGIRRPSTIQDSNESISTDEADLEVVMCFLPTGMVLDVRCHPDDELFEIKQIVITTATSDGKNLNSGHEFTRYG